MYRHVPLFSRGAIPADRERLDKLNPNSHVPVLDDDGFIVWESMAINLYLGDKHRGPLWPSDSRGRALVYQWSFWSQTEMDRRDWNAARRSGDAERIAASTTERVAALRILNAALLGRDYLLGSEFTFADLNVAATISQPNEDGRIDWQRLDPFELGLPALGDWLGRCTTRASWKKVRALS